MRKRMIFVGRCLKCAALSILSLGGIDVRGNTNTAITYQGHLVANGVGLNGVYELTFSLYDDPSGSSQLGTTITNTSVLISNGLFTTTVDFGSEIFRGEGRWLEIGV